MQNVITVKMQKCENGQNITIVKTVNTQKNVKRLKCTSVKPVKIQKC